MIKMRRITCSAMAIVAATFCGFTSHAFAGCNCQGGGVSTPAVAYGPVAMPSFGAPSYEMSGPIMDGGMSMEMGSSPYMGSSYSGSGYSGPPPGTLGRTYQLPSRPVPVEAHPRTGMVDIKVPGASEVVVHDTNAFRTEDVLDGFQDANDPDIWHFESEPLLPGLPHVYRIEARFGGPTGYTTQERYVRLIRGRLVELNF